MPEEQYLVHNLETIPIWNLDIAELEGHNLESKGREEVNAMLNQGWVLLHLYTLKYKEENEWRERPMAILGRPRDPEHFERNRHPMLA